MLIIAVTFCSCGVLKPTEDPTRHFILKDKPVSKLTTKSQLSVLVGTVTIPDYLDHSEIVTVNAEGDLDLAEFHVWAEPLDKGIGRVVASNVSKLLDSPNVGPFPQIDPIDFNYRVPIIVRRFEMREDGKIHLELGYAITTPGLGAKSSGSKSVSITKDVSDPTSHGSIAEAMSECLADLSRQISSQVLAVEKKRKAAEEAAEAAAEADGDGGAEEVEGGEGEA